MAGGRSVTWGSVINMFSIQTLRTVVAKSTRSWTHCGTTVVTNKSLLAGNEIEHGLLTAVTKHTHLAGALNLSS